MSMKHLGQHAAAGLKKTSTDVIADPRGRQALVAPASGGFEIIIDTQLRCITTDGRMATANRVIARACR